MQQLLHQLDSSKYDEPGNGFPNMWSPSTYDHSVEAFGTLEDLKTKSGYTRPLIEHYYNDKKGFTDLFGEGRRDAAAAPQSDYLRRLKGTQTVITGNTQGQ